VCLARDAQQGSLFPDGGGRIRLAVRVLDGAAAPVTDALVEIWQRGTEPAGEFAFGRLATDSDGCCEFETVRPSPPARGAAHVNVCLFARGLLRHLHTRVYFADDARVDEDPVLELLPRHRRSTLIATQDRAASLRWTFDIHLQGADETVFFDV
jgi:protocatechuate 3,4-dioxygenase alpha subunit